MHWWLASGRLEHRLQQLSDEAAQLHSSEAREVAGRGVASDPCEALSGVNSRCLGALWKGKARVPVFPEAAPHAASCSAVPQPKQELVSSYCKTPACWSPKKLCVSSWPVSNRCLSMTSLMDCSLHGLPAIKASCLRQKIFLRLTTRKHTAAKVSQAPHKAS